MELGRTTLSEGTALVTCEGRLTMTAAPAFRTYVTAVITDGSPRVVVDLTATSFLDSSGLGALIGTLKRARQEGGDLRISGPSEQVLTVLSLTNLDRVLKPYASVQEALVGW